jgi:hypothetical protein
MRSVRENFKTHSLQRHLLCGRGSTVQVHRGLNGELARGAELHDRSNLHLYAVFKSRTMPGDFDGLFFTVNMKEKIATDCFLGFDEGTIDDCVSLFSRDDFALVGERMSRRGPALLDQPFEPVVPLVHHSLHCFGRKAFMPGRAAKQQHVFRFRLRNIFAHDLLVTVDSNDAAPTPRTPHAWRKEGFDLTVRRMPQQPRQVKGQMPVISDQMVGLAETFGRYACGAEPRRTTFSAITVGRTKLRR